MVIRGISHTLAGDITLEDEDERKRKEQRRAREEAEEFSTDEQDPHLVKQARRQRNAQTIGAT